MATAWVFWGCIYTLVKYYCAKLAAKPKLQLRKLHGDELSPIFSAGG